MVGIKSKTGPVYGEGGRRREKKKNPKEKRRKRKKKGGSVTSPLSHEDAQIFC